jgi:TM2 domain-containing membrane protein YozV
MCAAIFGGWEILLVMGFFLCVVVIPVGAVVAIVYFIVNRPKAKPQQAPAAPLPPVPVQPAPVATKTVVMPRKCPQCGAALQSDAPEGLCSACLLQRGFGTEAGPSPNPTSFVPPSFSELALLFPQLELLECLGRGGMGAVYKARQPRLDRLVALKILAPEKQNDPQFAERFEREARALARLNHPNIVTVFDFGEVQGRFYLLMEFVDGLTLRQLLQTGKMTPAEALNIVPKICEALQFAHGQGIVHRDIKPENILLDKQGRVKIADFGIAKIAGLESTDFSLTGERDVMGTPHYMAPEQMEKPQTVDHRADIYSLGVVFYEMLTGELPLGKFALPSQKVHVDVRLDEVVLHALEKEPSRRYQQASQVKTAVETITGSPAEFAGAAAAAGASAPPAFPVAPANDASDKTILPAFLLAFFFGVFGAHRFYVGKIGTAILQLCTLGGLGIWSTIDWILILCKAFTDGQGRRMTNWIHPGVTTAKPAAQASAGGNTIPPLAKVPTPGDQSGMITAPAVALMVAGLWKLLSAVTAVFVLSGIGGWLGDFAGIGNIIGPWGSVAIVSIVLFKIIPGLLILFGGYQMLQRRSYGWAIAAGIISIISCSLIGFPVGVWALIVLARDDVKSAFGGDFSAAPQAPQTGGSGRSFAVVAGWLVLILVVLASLAALAVVFVPEISSAVGLNRTNLSGGRLLSEPDLTPEQLQQAGIVQGADGEFRKNITQSFPFNADGRFSLDNVNGRIEIYGWNSNVVAVAAVIHGKTGDSVEAIKVSIDSQVDRASVHTEQPRSQAGFHWSWRWLLNNWRDNASVDYTVHVPMQARLANISSVNGHVEIEGVTGDIAGSTVNGTAQIQDAAGRLKFSTVNGRITADMSRLGDGQSVALDAVNGRIELAVPENADAKFSASTVNGGITSEFSALEVKKEFPASKNLKGILGHGGASVKISTVNGGVKIIKRQQVEQSPANLPAVLANENSLPLSTNTGVLSIGNMEANIAVAQWLAVIDRGTYLESWNQASAIFQGAVTEAAWENSMNTFRKPLGAVVSRQLKSAEPMTQMPGAPDGQYIVMQFETSFAEKKSAIETVTFDLEKDGQWKSSGYFIK